MMKFFLIMSWVHSNRGNLALWTRSVPVGSAIKSRPNPALPIFSRPYLWCKVVATQDLGFHEHGEDSQGSMGGTPKSWVAAMLGGIFFEI